MEFSVMARELASWALWMPAAVPANSHMANHLLTIRN